MLPIRLVPIALLASFCIFFTLLIVAAVQAENREVTVQDAFAFLQTPHPDLVILDIRTPKEFHAGHIAGAVQMNFASPTFQIILAQLPRDQPYLIYCRSANRSEKTFQFMKNMDFKNVIHMKGGVIQWTEHGFPLVRTSYAGGH